jgi:predicted DNA-binding transcriptional regulator AlpA
MTHLKRKSDLSEEIRRRSREITDYAIVRTAEAAAILSITPKHLHTLSKEPGFPKKVRLGTHAVGWKIADLEAWINSKMDGSLNSGGENGEI